MSNGGRNGDHFGLGDGDDVSLDTFMSTTSCPSTLTPDGDDLDKLSIGSWDALRVEVMQITIKFDSDEFMDVTLLLVVYLLW